MKIVYLLTDRYEHAEFYDFYGKGLYDSLDAAKADWKNELYDFLAYGPDDCHDFRLTKNEVSDEDYEMLTKFVSEYHEGSLDRNANSFTKEMERIVNGPNSTVIFEETDSANFEIAEMAEVDGIDNVALSDSPELFTKYFDKYFSKHYSL